jgi:threonine/homoserine/homoserine lactone efflux protein
MPSLGAILVFVTATFVLTVTPGPGVLYVIGRCVGGGRRAGIASMLGIETGEAVYIAGVALGITAVLAASPVALSVLRYGGAAYLVLLGIRAWRERADHEAETTPAGGSIPRVYGRGLVVQLLNPKVAVFFIAYFPQFVRAGHPAAPQVLVLGAIYLAIAVIVDGCYVLASSWLANIGRSEKAQRRRARFSAITYFVLAAAALLLGDRSGSAGALGPSSA